MKAFKLTGIPRAILDTITGKSISAPPYEREKITMKKFVCVKLLTREGNNLPER